MKILVACEFSGVVRDAFIAAGHDAISCDLLPTETPGNHYQGNVKDIIYQIFSSLRVIRWKPTAVVAGEHNLHQK